jgi:hypothetical protein
MHSSHSVSNVKIIGGASVFGVDSDTKHMVEMESGEGNVVDVTRVRLCPTLLVSEVKALRAEVNILKRSLEEEKESRKFGDYLSGEAIWQLQSALQLDLTQHLTSENNLRQHFEAEMLREMSNSKQTLENRLSHHEIVDKELRAFRVELDREFKHQFEQFDRRFEEAQHKFKNLTSAVLSKSAHASGISEAMQRLNDERVDYQSVCMAKPHKITMVEEHTDSADDGAVDAAAPMTEENVRRRIARWEVRGTCDHDAIRERTGCLLEKETSCSWDLLKTFDEEVIIDKTDSALEDGKCCEVTIMM